MFWETCLPQICIERNTDDETSAEKLEETVEEIRATDRQLPSFVMGGLSARCKGWMSCVMELSS
jgi:hypothetical protein